MAWFNSSNRSIKRHVRIKYEPCIQISFFSPQTRKKKVWSGTHSGRSVTAPKDEQWSDSPCTCSSPPQQALAPAQGDSGWRSAWEYRCPLYPSVYLAHPVQSRCPCGNTPAQTHARTLWSIKTNWPMIHYGSVIHCSVCLEEQQIYVQKPGSSD